MSTTPSPRTVVHGRARKTVALWLLLGLQAICALFFIADVVTDFAGLEYVLGGVDHHNFELLVVLALVLGMAFIAHEIRKVLGRQKRLEVQIGAASGAFMELLEQHFDIWSLTPAERDVALLVIKGLSIAEIAALRSSKEGTVKAQCNAIYAKAGVKGRHQLLSYFVEELMGERLIDAQVADQWGCGSTARSLVPKQKSQTNHAGTEKHGRGWLGDSRDHRGKLKSRIYPLNRHRNILGRNWV